MAEIKSTMDMVLERAARMAASAAPDTDNEELLHKGMRLAAEFLTKKETKLGQLLDQQPPKEQVTIRKGMAQTLLRNVVLPRDAELQALGKLALQGLVSLGDNSSEIKTICLELTQILEQYGQHKDQMIKQLEDAIKAQLEHQQRGSRREGQPPLSAASHPQYREELARMLASLNDQYNEAMNQRKQLVLERFSVVVR